MEDKKLIKNEIGSEFWDIPITEMDNKIFIQGTKWFISGTAALEYILANIKKEKEVKTVALPSWCCSCMITPFLKNKIEVKFYSVYLNNEKKLVCDYTKVDKCDIYLLISYFGYTTQKNIGSPTGIIIRDITHSIFSKSYTDADYYFGSLRKWAGFWTGGYAWSNKEWNKNIVIENLNKEYIEIREKAMRDKIDYLYGKSNSKKYLDLFNQAEEYLDHCDIVSGCERDKELAHKMDVQFIKNQRCNNARILLNELKDIAIFSEITNEDCPLFVPIILPNYKRNLLRKYLIEHEVYCPVHWEETKLHNLSFETRKLYEEELSIICDQRYNERDMERIVKLIKEFSEKLKI